MEWTWHRSEARFFYIQYAVKPQPQPSSMQNFTSAMDSIQETCRFSALVTIFKVSAIQSAYCELYLASFLV